MGEEDKCGGVIITTSFLLLLVAVALAGALLHRQGAVESWSQLCDAASLGEATRTRSGVHPHPEDQSLLLCFTH